MKKILLFLLISLSSLGQYRGELIDLGKAPYNLAATEAVRNFGLLTNGEPTFIFTQTFEKSITTNRNHSKWGIATKQGGLYQKFLLPFEYSFNLPTQVFVDDKDNVLVPSVDHIFGYHVFSQNNKWKSFLAYNNQDLQYFKTTYVGYEIIQQTLAADLLTYPSKKNTFNGKEIVAVSSYNVLLDKYDDYSLYKLTSENQQSINDFFSLSKRNISLANTQPQNVGNFFPEPVHLSEGINGDIWASYLGSFDNFLIKFSGQDALLYKLNSPGDIDAENAGLIADKKGGLWWYKGDNLSYVEGNIVKSVLSNFGGLYEGVEFQIDNDNKLWYLDEKSNKLVSLTTAGQKSEIDISALITDKAIKLIYDSSKETFWILMRNNKFVKVSKQIDDTDRKPEDDKKPIVRILTITRPTATSEINVSDGLKISFNLSEGTILGTCRIEILKLNGQLEKLLSKNFSSAGIDTFPFKINDVPSGEYYVKLSGSTQPNLKDSVKVFITNNTILERNEQVGLFWRNNELAQSNTTPAKPIGIVADGTSKILLRIKPSEENILRAYRAEVRVVTTAELQSSAYLGSVLPVGNTVELDSPNQLQHVGLVSTSNQTKIDGEFIFEYQAPVDFNHPSGKVDASFESSREVNANVTIYTVDGKVLETQGLKIRVVRPPLMLAHGLGGEGSKGKSTWRNFRYSTNDGNEVLFKNSDLFLVKRDINLLPTASFDANSDVLLGKSTDSNLQNESFDAMIKQMNDMGYACAKVDYVAHSMGGSVLRNTIDKPEYKNLKNYNQGYVNKFISICTPHEGSPLGDIVAEFSPHAVNNYASRTGLDIALLSLSGYYDFKYGLAVPAVQNLAIRVENGGVKFPEQTIKNHTIVGNYVNKFENDEAAFNNLDIINKVNQGFPYLTLVYAYAALKKFKDCGCTKEFDELSRITEKNLIIRGPTFARILNWVTNGELPGLHVAVPDKGFVAEFLTWMSARVYPAAPPFMRNSDMIVSVESQSAGKFREWPKNFTSKLENSYTVYDGITHNFSPFNATADPLVGNRVFELLNKPINSAYFATELAASPIITSPISCSGNSCFTSIAPSEDFIKIYPNPTPDVFSIDLTEIPEFETGSLSIFDEVGTIIYNIPIDGSCCKNLQVPFLRAGVYSVSVLTNNQVFTKKIVINK